MTDINHSLSLDTLAIRAGGMRTSFNEHSEALFPTVSFVHESAEMAAKRFTGEEPGYFDFFYGLYNRKCFF